ncbi:OmpA family protein [Hymenobacter tibetensis]|uniref:OmpA family protein n=1 Tax=Hymenobacter tibetensis TaxID=497967 RepID=A0ABY4CS93_9BACT|nr:OmpA family protein [Hymenobacter tibetensis]UOG73021.1 OmpA family protein [Hymenobacter tibetensis]
MKTNVVEAVKFCFTGKLITQISLSVDENEKRVEKALEKAIPLVLESLMLRAERAGGPTALLNMACEAYAADLLHHLPHLATTAWYTTSAGLMQGLAGDGYDSLINRIAIVSGVRPTAGEGLLLIAAAAVLSVLGRYATENELSPTEFVNWFKAQKVEVAMALFPDMNRQPDSLTDSLEGAHHLSALRRPTAVVQRPGLSAEHGTWAPVGGGSIFTPQPETTAPAAPAASSTTGFRWQWSLLLLFAVCLGYYFGHERLTTIPGTVSAFADSPGANPTAVVNATEAGATTTPLGTYDRDRDMYIYDTGQPIVLTLANGSSQKVGANSTENRLYTFLSDPSFQVDSVNRTKGWINFDRVYFDAGKATLTSESEQQLHNIAEVLKTFPEATVKLGGYTDNTGLDTKNLVLSEERAKTAALALVKKGIPFHRLQFKGYGSKYFVATNETPEGRALNRRISIRVVKK